MRHGGERRPIHSRYGDGTLVYDGESPPRIRGPVAAGAPQTVLRWDELRRRLYQAREYTEDGSPVRDIDWTVPTTPAGRLYTGHPTGVHQHRWIQVDPDNPAAGLRRGDPEELR